MRRARERLRVLPAARAAPVLSPQLYAASGAPRYRRKRAERVAVAHARRLETARRRRARAAVEQQQQWRHAGGRPGLRLGRCRLHYHWRRAAAAQNKARMQRHALLLPRGVHVRGEAGGEGLQAYRGQAAEAARGAARLAQRRNRRI